MDSSDDGEPFPVIRDPGKATPYESQQLKGGAYRYVMSYPKNWRVDPSVVTRTGS